MAELLSQGVVVLVAGLVIWGLWRIGRPRPVFVVRIADGEPRAVAGTVTPAFLQCVREVAASYGIASGRVTGTACGHLIRLHFSRQIPEPGRQKMRNWWATSGWPLSRKRGLTGQQRS